MAGTVACLGCGVARAQTPVVLDGTWITEDRSSRIAFQACPTGLCGKVVWLKEPIDPDTGKPAADLKNPDPALRGRPVLGLEVLTEVHPTGANSWAGKAYNVEDGEMYKIAILRKGPRELEIEGCGLMGLVCQTEIWARSD